MFARSGQVASDPSKAVCPSQGAEAPGYFLAYFDHTDVLLGLVIGEGNAQIMQEGEDPGLMLIQAVQQILRFGLFRSPAFGQWVRRRGNRIGVLAFGHQCSKACEPGGFLGRGQLRGPRFLGVGKGGHVAEQGAHGTCPALVVLFEQEFEFA